MGFCWSTLRVRNLEESLKFYEEIVGLKVQNRFAKSQDTELVFLGDGQTKIELVYNKTKTDVNVGEDISWGFEVDSVDKKVEFLKEKGIEIISGPVQPSPNIKFFYVRDPNGLKIQFVENS